MPCRAGDLFVVRCRHASLSKKRRDVLGHQLAEADEAVDRGVIVDQDQADVERLAIVTPSEQVENLKHLELIVQIMLEPKHDLTRRAENLEITLFKLIDRLPEGAPTQRGEELRSDTPQILRTEVRRYGALMEHIAPGQNLSGKPGGSK